MTSKPEGYPLPWCDAIDLPYWKVSYFLCHTREGWREWQTGKRMAEIIPHIDALIPNLGANQ